VTATAAGDPTLSHASEVYFDAGLPGFPCARRFRLSPLAGTEGRFWLLACLDAPDLEFVVVPPQLFFPSYVAEINGAAAHRIGLERPDEAAVYVIVTLGPTPVDATANLLGPLVVNHRNMSGAQLALEGASGRVNTPLLARREGGS
jgi:flagellar assembly factor FliW